MRTPAFVGLDASVETSLEAITEQTSQSRLSRVKGMVDQLRTLQVRKDRLAKETMAVARVRSWRSVKPESLLSGGTV